MMGKYAIGVDLGGTVIKIGLVADGRIVGRSTLAADSRNGLRHRLPLIADRITAMLAEHGVSREAFAGVGVCFPGLADSDAGKVLSTNAKYDDAVEVDIAGWAKAIYGGAFYMDNDARMAVVGEWKYGAGRGSDNVVAMTIGTGIGCGVIIEGRLLKGVHYQAGCLGGHMVVDYRGRRCSCGNVGCAEATASSFFLNDIVRESNPLFYEQHAPFDFRKIFQMAREGDKDAWSICEECMNVWAAAIVNLIHAYDPEKIVLSGGIMRSADLILPYLRKRVASLAWTPWGEVEIAASELMDDAGILGAVECVMNKSENR